MSIAKEFTPRPDAAERLRGEWQTGGPTVAPLFAKDKRYFKGSTRRIWKLKWVDRPGRSRRDSCHDWSTVLERIRDLYTETNATERDLVTLYRARWGVPDWGAPVSRRVVRIALGRRV
jgi:hypothetical protein